MVPEHRILQQGVKDEAKRTVLREAQSRYLHELLDDEERQVLRDRVLRLRREQGL
jgi:DNA-directed RNA polymerase sigma subunit (sigma70/sigma32)